MFAPVAVSRLAITLPLAALAGCSAGSLDDFPTLDRRAAESSGEAAPPPPPPPGPPGAALAADIAAWRGQAAAADAAFAAARPAAERLAAAGAGRAPAEPWVIGQQQLSRLNAVRAPATAALANLDQALLAALAANNLAGFAELAAARAQVRTLVNAQDRVLRQIGDQLGE